MEHIEQSFSLLGKGLLGPWETAAATLAAAVLAWLALRGDLRKVRARPLARALIATKALTVLLLGWFLYEPALYVKKTITKPGSLILLIDDSASMGVVDESENASELLDLVEAASGAPIPNRAGAPREVRRLFSDARAAVADALRGADAAANALEEGLPGGNAGLAEVERAGTTLRGVAKDLKSAADQTRAELQLMDVYRLSPAQQQPLRLRAETLSLAVERMQALPKDLETLAKGGPLSSEMLSSLREALRGADKQFEAAVAEAIALRNALDDACLRSAEPAVAALCERTRALNRLDLLRAVLAKDPDAASLPKRHRVTTFSLTHKDKKPLAQLAPDGAATDFVEPIRAVLNKFSRETVSAVILCSDGQQNSFASLDPILKTLAAKGIPLYTVAVGSARPVRDLAVADYRLPVLALKGRGVPVSVTVKTDVPKDTPFIVGLREGDRTLASEKFTAAGERDQTVALNVTFEQPGVRPVTIAVSLAEGKDKFPSNDAVSDAVQTLEEKARVLVVADVPGWDARYVLDAMESLPVKVETVFTGESDKPPRRGASKGAIPKTDSQWKKYQVVILAGEPFAGFGDEDAKALREAVVKEGVGLLVLPGSPGKASYLSALGAAFAWGEMKPGTTGPDVAQFPPPAGLLHFPPLDLRPKALDALATWRRFDLPEQVSAVPPQDLVLLKSAAGAPLLSFGVHGKGRCVCLGMADLHRMRLFDPWPDANLFLRKLVALALTDPFDGTSEIGALPFSPCAQAPTRLFFRASHETQRNPKLQWTAGQTTDEVVLGSGSPGTFSARAVFPNAPEVALNVNLGERTVSRKLPVRTSLNDERVYFASDEAFLKRLAEETGGQFVRLTELGRLCRQIQPRPQTEVRVTEYSLWHHWFALLLLVGVVTAEYIVRRKAGMVL